MFQLLLFLLFITKLYARSNDGFSKYASVVPLKDKKGESIVNAFQKILNDSPSSEATKGRKPNKIWVDKGSEFYSNSFKKWLKR